MRDVWRRRPGPGQGMQLQRERAHLHTQGLPRLPRHRSSMEMTSGRAIGVPLARIISGRYRAPRRVKSAGQSLSAHVAVHLPSWVSRWVTTEPVVGRHQRTRTDGSIKLTLATCLLKRPQRSLWEQKAAQHDGAAAHRPRRQVVRIEGQRRGAVGPCRSNHQGGHPRTGLCLPPLNRDGQL